MNKSYTALQTLAEVTAHWSTKWNRFHTMRNPLSFGALPGENLPKSWHDKTEGRFVAQL